MRQNNSHHTARGHGQEQSLSGHLFSAILPASPHSFTTADFTRLFRELQNTSVLSGEAESLLAFAAEQGVVHYFPRDRYQQMRIDAESDLRHYTSVREELGKDFRELKGRSSEMNARGSDISKAYADLEKESAELTARYYEVCQRKYGLFNRMVSGLKNIPLVGNLVEASSSLDAKLEEAKQSRVDAIKQQERELEQLIKGLESKDSLAKEVEKAKELLARADEDLNAARYHFTELDEFIETDRGYFRVLPEVKLLLELRSESARSADSAITIFNDHESLCHLIDKRVQEVTECQKHLVEFYSYPTLAAELVSWYISSSESTNLKQTISDFVDRNMDFADVVAPSYVQVFLSLNAPPGGLSIPEYAEELAYVSKDLPAFSRAERYFIGREMLKIEPEADSEPQERVMKLVNALTGPNYESLSKFEMFLTAARLAGFSGEPGVIANNFSTVYSHLLEYGIPAGSEAISVAQILLQGKEQGKERIQGFVQALELYKSYQPDKQGVSLTQFAFVSLLPGDVRNYVYCLITAEAELKASGMDPVKARTLALPAALPSLGVVWKDELEAEAVALAKKAREINFELECRPAKPRDEEALRAMLLSEELLNTISALNRLYENVDGIKVDTLWEGLATVLKARELSQQDRALLATKASLVKAADTGKSKAKEQVLEKPIERYTLEELRELQSELRRVQREAEFGGEYS